MSRGHNLPPHCRRDFGLLAFDSFFNDVQVCRYAVNPLGDPPLRFPTLLRLLELLDELPFPPFKPLLHVCQHPLRSRPLIADDSTRRILRCLSAQSERGTKYCDGHTACKESHQQAIS